MVRITIHHRLGKKVERLLRAALIYALEDYLRFHAPFYEPRGITMIGV